MSGKSPSDGAELPTNHVRPRCILLDGHDFDPYFNHVLLQHVRGEIEIAGILTVHREIGTILGFEALHSEDIGKETFDYIIVMDVEGFLELRRRLVSCFQVEPDKIVSCSPFSEPGFSFATYSSKARHPTLVAANCFGGLAYNFEGWRFDSPFVNMLVSIPGMLKLIEDFEGYIDRELKLVRMVGSGKGRYPLVMLGDVSIRMMHYHSFEDALAKWEERKARMNRDEVVFFLYWRGSKDLFVKNPSGRRVYVLTNRPDKVHGATAIYAPEYECARARGLSILTFARYVFDNRNISSAAFRVHRLMAGLECSTREYATVPETEGRVDLRLQALYAHIDRSVTMYMLAESGEDLVSGCGFTSKDLSTLMGNLLEAESYRDAIRIFDAYRGIADEGCVGMLSKALVLLHDKRSRSEGIRLIRRYSESYDLGDDALRLSEEDPGDDPDMSSQDTLTRDGVSRCTK